MTIQLGDAIAAKTVESAYALTASALIAAGYPALPVGRGTKFPGVDDHPLAGWTQYCDKLPRENFVVRWSRNHDNGVCIALGFRGVVAIDIDSDDPAVAAAVDAIAGVSPVRKRGRRGFTAFFRASAAVKSRPFKFDNGDGVDLLAHGRQTVLPPTIHPSTGQPYQWTTDDTLEHVTPEHLPELPDDIAAQLAVALAPFGYVEEPVVAHAPREGSGDTIWAETNEAALAKLDAWVPVLGIGAKRKGAAWRAAAGWRGGENDNVSFHPKGIKDFVTDEGLTPIDIVMKARGCANGEALTWLRDKLGLRDPEPVEFRLKMKGDAASEPDGDTAPTGVDAAVTKMARAYARARIANGGEHPELTDDLRQVYRESLQIMVLDVGPEAEPEPKADWRAASSHPLDSVTLGSGVDWTRPGGLLGDISDWIIATSHSPNRPLAVAASVATLAAATGWAKLHAPTGCTLNPYIIMLGRTAIGKDRALKAVGQLLTAAGFAKLYASNNAYSIAGLEAILVEQPAVVMSIDEIAKNMLPRMMGRKASSHETSMQGFITTLWARNMGDPPYITTRRSPKSEVQHEKVESPQFTLLGANVPEGFYEALQSDSVDSGFMNRLLIAEAAPRVTNDDRAELIVPKDIADRLKEIALDGRTGDLAAFSRPALERKVPWASDAVQAEWRKLRDAVLAIIDSEAKDGALFGRTAEYAARLATVHALSLHGPEAAVTLDDLEWGAAWAIDSALKMQDSAANMMARTDHEKMVNAVKAIIRKAGEISQSDLTRRAQHISSRDRDAILAQLEMAEIIIKREVKSKTRSKMLYRWVGE